MVSPELGLGGKTYKREALTILTSRCEFKLIEKNQEQYQYLMANVRYN